MADRYEDRDRGGEYRGDRERYGRHDRYGREDRGFVERAGDEVRSWFGDEEAERRRRLDEQRQARAYERYDRGRDAWGYGRDPGGYERDEGRYMRDWDYGHRMGFDYGASRGWSDRPSHARERSWAGDRWGAAVPTGPYTSREGYVPYPYREHEERSRYGPEWDRGRGSESWHAGRGPRNYQRSDERIREDVCDRLGDDPYVDASDVEVTVRGGEVTLSGNVRDRYDKRRTEDLVDGVAGVREVHNHLRLGGSRESTAAPTQDRTARKAG
jgi:osmotically-inducible protein OsmY